MTPAPATTWSVAFIRELIAGGVDYVVVSPGSRSQALALAAVAWEKVPHSPLQVIVAIDERSAGFIALGLAIESGGIVACVSTSGSAPAHYYPALLEALHQGVGIIAISADRPEELHGIGANQTTNQREFYGSRISSISVPAPEDAAAESSALNAATAALMAASRPGPVQVNVAFREPLSSRIPASTLVLPERKPTVPAASSASVLEVTAEPGTLVIAGSGAGAWAEQLARDLGSPLIAEVHSGARFGPHVVPRYREVLGEPSLRDSLRRVVTVGRPTLSREVWSLVSRGDIEQIVVVGSEIEPVNPSGVAVLTGELRVVTPATGEQSAAWTKPWVLAGRAAYDQAIESIAPRAADIEALTSDDQATRSAFAKAEMTVLRHEVGRAGLALALWEATWPHDRLVLGASRMIREIDQIAPGKNVTVYSNRGLSGIDGTIGTARGIARAAARSGAQGITRVLLGDLSFLHDVGSLLVEPGAVGAGRVHVVVANDGGGTIFDLLETPDGVDASELDRVLYTPQEASIEHLARGYGWDYLRVVNRGDLAEAMSRSDERLVIEVVLQRRG